MEWSEIDTRLDSATPVRLRPMRQDDVGKLREGIAALSPRSRYLRFFSAFEKTPESIIRRLVDIDGVNHIAWGALDCSSGKAIGAAHAIRTGAPGEADFALGVLDEYHGRGVSRLMIASLVQDCLSKGLWTFRADVLSENTKAIALFKALGGRSAGRNGAAITFRLNLYEADRKLRAMPEPAGLVDVHAAFPEPAAA